MSYCTKSHDTEPNYSKASQCSPFTSCELHPHSTVICLNCTGSSAKVEHINFQFKVDSVYPILQCPIDTVMSSVHLHCTEISWKGWYLKKWKASQPLVVKKLFENQWTRKKFRHDDCNQAVVALQNLNLWDTGIEPHVHIVCLIDLNNDYYLTHI